MNTRCTLCPRNCRVDRKSGGFGFCLCADLPVIARSAPHYGEEPCISGVRGSGTVFFSGCNMHCVFCQNRKISFDRCGKTVDIPRLAEIFSELEESGVHNINLVTPTHFTDKIIEALKIAKLKIPVVWNSSAYESVETLKTLEGYVQVYMPAFKYTSSDAAFRYSGAKDYPNIARSAIIEMYRQTGKYVMDDEGLLKRGVLVRHLILPDRLDDAFDVIDWIAEYFPKDAVLISLMSQFVPFADKERFPELARSLTQQEYDRVLNYLSLSGIENGYFQELSSATDELIPSFDLTGVE